MAPKNVAASPSARFCDGNFPPPVTLWRQRIFYVAMNPEEDGLLRPNKLSLLILLSLFILLASLLSLSFIIIVCCYHHYYK